METNEPAKDPVPLLGPNEANQETESGHKEEGKHTKRKEANERKENIEKYNKDTAE